MIILHDFSFENIRSFVDKQVVSLEDRDKLIQIDGKNKNTGGSSGSGKSTALIAIDYLLGLSDIPSTVLQSWLTKADMSVEGNFTINGVKTFIKRSKKKGLYLKYGDAEFEGSLAEEKLEQIIAIPKNVFKQMIHKKQDEKGFFLNKTAKQMYEFLIDMLDLGDQDKKLQKVSEHIKVLAKQAESAALSISNTENSIKDLEAILSQKQEPIPVDVSGLAALQSQKIQIQNKINEIESKKHEALKFIVKPNIPPYEEYDMTTALKLGESAELLKQKGDSMSQESARLNRLLAEISHQKGTIEIKSQTALDKAKKLEILRNKKCFTCQQHFSGEEATLTENSLISEIESIKQEIASLNANIAKESELLASVKVYESNIEKIQNKYRELHVQIAEERKNAAEHKKKYDDMVDTLTINTKNQQLEITSKFDAAVGDLKSQIWPIDSQIQKLETEHSNYLKNLENYNQECTSLKRKMDEYKKTHAALSSALADAQKELKIAEEAQRLIKTYTIQVFQETLDLIGDVATEMVASIPNIQNSSIYFEGCKETQSGSIKDEVTPMITLNGHNKVPIKAFSGGERTAIELAVDLAVIDVIESKTGKGANFFIMDEPFNGLDSVCKESCLEVLKQYDTNKKIIMVDHSSELKEMVSDVITVVKEGEVSYIE